MDLFTNETVNIEYIKDSISKLLEGATISESVNIINNIREHIHNLSPFKSEPVDFVKWVDFTSSQKKKVGERVKFYKMIIAYLESEPKEEDLKIQLEEVKRKIKVLFRVSANGKRIPLNQNF